MKSVQGMVALFTLLLGVVGACSSPAANTGGSETNWVTCAHDADCKTGNRCDTGRCTPIAAQAIEYADASPSTDAARAVTPETYTEFARLLSVHRRALTPEDLTGVCLLSPLTPDEHGHVPCTVLQATTGDACACAGAGIGQPDPGDVVAMQQLLSARGICDVAGTPPCREYCVCAVSEMTGSDHTSCLNDAALTMPEAGYCYVDPAQGLGGTTLADRCPYQPVALRLHNPALTDYQIGVWCSQTTAANAPVAGARSAKIGEPCAPVRESQPEFSGYSPEQVSVETNAPECASRVCVVANFQGRVSCPYGQIDASSPNGCTTTGSNPVRVTVPVPGQIIARPPSKAVYCSERCDGVNGPPSSCPSGFTCTPFLAGVSGVGAPAASYCLKTGTVVTDPETLATETTCDSTAALTLECGPG